MSLRSALLYISFCVSTVCLSLGYLIAGEWLMVPIILLAWIIWFAFSSRALFWSASIAFLLYFLLAGFGIYSNFSLPLMATGGFSALIMWDLLIFNHSEKFLGIKPTTNRLEKKHLKSLSLAALVGILATLSAASFNYQLSFEVVFVLVLVAVSCFIIGVRTLSEDS